ncbi:MAG: alpha/beta fold hydrolase [Saprospiraceae bacterium]|nr:alpha/beta fold hydrolase [Saprospiraceae bacterium]
MKRSTFIKSLEPRFRQPEGYRFGNYFPSNRGRVRFGILRSENERAFAIFTSGLGANLEMDFETSQTLADLGVTCFVMERFGEGGSGRPFSGKDRQKPALIFPYEYASDLLRFVDFQKKVLKSSPEKPLILIGVCYGCLTGLYACLQNDRVFDHAFLTSPMLGLRWSNGAEHEWVFPISPETEMEYVGKARDWDWQLGQKLIANDPTSHDPARSRLKHLWWRQYPRLRLGGYTYGFIHRSSLGVVRLFEEGQLERISTPITLVSASDDVINDNRRHVVAAARLPNATHHLIEGARHGLWREADLYRNQMLDLLKGILGKLDGKMPRRQNHQPLTADSQREAKT